MPVSAMLRSNRAPEAMTYQRTKLLVDAAGARRRITYKWPYATMLKGRHFTMRGTLQQIMTFRSTLSRYAARTGKVFQTEKLGYGRIDVRRWL